MSVISLAGLALLGWASAQTWFYEGLGISSQSNAMALALFMLVVPVFLFFLHPLMTSLSRKYEFEADAYAASVANADDLVERLAIERRKKRCCHINGPEVAGSLIWA